jgi:hypothetical protein
MHVTGVATLTAVAALTSAATTGAIVTSAATTGRPTTCGRGGAGAKATRVLVQITQAPHAVLYE